MTIEQLRQQIETAFQGLPIPDAEVLVGRYAGMNEVPAERIRAELAGKSWQSLTAEFLETRWASYCYLTPEAYRYYLPALLVTALDRLPDEKGLPHSVVFSLRPCFCSLFFEGEDAKLRARQARFSRGQYQVVCDFLGFILRTTGLRYLAAQGLRWGWSAIETSALEEALAFYRNLHHFPARPITDPVRARLAEQVRTAFADTPYPGDQALCDYGDDEANELGMEFRGVDWRSLHPRFLHYNYTALTFLSDAGFRFYLPAFLLAELADYDPEFGCGNANPEFSLTYGLTHPETSASRREDRERSIRRFSTFTPIERQAIVAYLEYQVEADEYDVTDIQAALASYWRPSVLNGE